MVAHRDKEGRLRLGYPESIPQEDTFLRMESRSKIRGN